MAENDIQEQKTPLSIHWKLHTIMSDRGIRTATELHRRLQPYGIRLTSHQLSRVVAGLPARLNTELLAALLTELECTPNDLLRLNAPTALARSPEPCAEPPAAPTEHAEKPARASRTPRAPVAEVPQAVLGPKITSILRKPKA